VLDSGSDAPVRVADHALRLAVERAQERLPVIGCGGVERLKAPQQTAAVVIAQRAEDVESDHATRDGAAVGGGCLDAERHLVEHKRSLGPQRWPVRLEDDWREDLDEVADELPVAAVARTVVARRVPRGTSADAR
jgi:hypothetical protein